MADQDPTTPAPDSNGPDSDGPDSNGPESNGPESNGPESNGNLLAAASDGNPDAITDAPQASTIAQYVKDLSAESPSAPTVFQWQTPPALDVQFGINGSQVGEDVHEVILKIEVNAKSDSGTHFIVDLTYAGLFGFRNIPEEALPPFLLVEAPRLLFPFARQIVADAIQNLGFPPVLLDPIDFAAAYVAQSEAQAQTQPGGAGEPPVGHA